MAPKGCPIKYPHKCKHCPIPPWDRVKICPIYRGQIASGVPWHWKADRRWFGYLPRNFPHPLTSEAVKLKMLERIRRKLQEQQ